MEKEHLIKHFLISNLIKKLIMSDIYSDNNKIQKKSHFNLKFEKYKFSKSKLKRSKNSGLRRFFHLFKKEKSKIIILVIIVTFILMILVFSAISQFLQ